MYYALRKLPHFDPSRPPVAYPPPSPGAHPHSPCWACYGATGHFGGNGGQLGVLVPATHKRRFQHQCRSSDAKPQRPWRLSGFLPPGTCQVILAKRGFGLGPQRSKNPMSLVCARHFPKSQLHARARAHPLTHAHTYETRDKQAQVEDSLNVKRLATTNAHKLRQNKNKARKPLEKTPHGPQSSPRRLSVTHTHTHTHTHTS